MICFNFSHYLIKMNVAKYIYIYIYKDDVTEFEKVKYFKLPLELMFATSENDSFNTDKFAIVSINVCLLIVV